MPNKSFKSMFVELVSFLTLFALIGSMTSSFWERYLIQSELSNMKSSLHVLKETVLNIGTAYDTLHKELTDLMEIRDIKSSKSLSKASSERRNTNQLELISNMMMQELMKTKANQSVGINSSKETYSLVPSIKDMKSLKNVSTVTKYPLKSTGVPSSAKHVDIQLYHNNNKDPVSSYKSNNIHTQIHNCCKDTGRIKK